MKRAGVPFLGVALFLLMACDTGSGRDRPSESPSTLSAPSAQSAVDPIEGEWHQTFTCEENVRTFQRNLSDLRNQKQRFELAKLEGNKDSSIQTLLLEYTRYFAWGPNAPAHGHAASTAAQIQPAAICKGAPDRERTIRFLDGSLVIQDWDHSTEGPASYEFVNDHAFTVNDGGQNFGCCPSRPIDTFSFQIDGDILTLTMMGQDDPWGGTALEESPWQRVS